MEQDNRTAKRKLGDMGENIACSWLESRGFKVIERNYLKKWGEIDIIARKADLVRFIEVKSVSCATLEPVYPEQGRRVPHVTSYRPEDNVHPGKLRRLARAIQTYILDRDVKEDWQLDVITVRIHEPSRKARIEIIENIII